MGSSIIVGAISRITHATDGRPVSIWIGSTGPLVLPEDTRSEGWRRGRLCRAVFHTTHDGALIVEALVAMPPASP